MLRQQRWAARALRATLTAALTVALGVGLGGCGEASGTDAEAAAERALADCRSQWREVGESVDRMDEDPHPSSLADRWTSVIATVEYYKTTETATNCQANVETQLKAVTALRQFSDKLRPYDMTYQASQARAAIDLYLNTELPAPVVGENGRKVRPPAKAAVAEAMQALNDNAEQANVELEPGWAQTSSVDLTDVTALTQTMQDLDFLAQDSQYWQRCEEALQVLVAAIRFQEGLVGAPTSGPTDVTTPTG